MKCKNPECNAELDWWDTLKLVGLGHGKCIKCMPRTTVKRIDISSQPKPSQSSKQIETIPLSASPNGPELDTSEMSNTELLRRMEFNTRKTSAWTVKIYWLIFIAILVGPLIQQTVIGILVSIGLANQ